MDPKIIFFIVGFLFIIPRFLSFARAQVQDVESLISDIASPQRNLDLGLSLLKDPGRNLAFREINRNPETPDTSFQIPSFATTGEPVYNPSLLMMVKGMLSKQEVLLEYFPCDTIIIAVAVTKETFCIHTVRAGPEVWHELAGFKRKIRLADFGNCRNQSEVLSDVLLKPVSESLKGKTKAVIIAHTALYGFPFEVLVYPLLPSAQAGGKTKFLIEGREIVYNNSVTQWLSSRIRGKTSTVNASADNNLAFAGFSPGFEFHECIQELHDAGTEISRIGKMFKEKGKTPVILLNENSNESNFKSIARYSHIIHIATHTISSTDFPDMNGLLFHEFGSHEITDEDDGLLAIREICELRIPADLIVINACASANIRSRIGLNWFSCADCFMKAGARNVLCTLWNISDRVAERFMVEFYRYYLGGMSYSKALQQVKVRMISEPSTSLPLNWAAYVL
ncbi:MAG: CHAT domain-containing protein, partial [Bacteroidetes bacterium]|nr:CHAT domain-containing protein [Bacteroidota bacterium]